MKISYYLQHKINSLLERATSNYKTFINVDKMGKSKLFAFLLTFATICLFAHGAPIVNQQILNEIFNQYKIYMIHVYEETDLIMESYFNGYCSDQQHLCAVMDKSVDNFETFRAYIGETKTQYFLIIDAARKKKYIMPIIEGITEVDLRIFNAKFQSGQLIPFEASQEPDSNPYAPCRKIVAKDLNKFLKQQTPIKVVFLYTTHSSCHVCGQMLRLFADLAEKMYDPEIVQFGYYDIFKNDNLLITDEIMSHFLIFVNENSAPYEVRGEQMDELYEKIVEVIMKDTGLDTQKYKKLGLDMDENEKEEENNNDEL